MPRTIIALVPDAYGGRGGMAVYDQHLLSAVCSYDGVDNVVALPRDIVYELEAMPSNLVYHSWAAGTKPQYLGAVVDIARRSKTASLILCGHLNLLPFAQFLALRFRCRVLPVCYGVEAWRPTRHRSANYLCRRLSAFIAIRKLTADRLKAWANIPEARFHYLPNCIHLSRYGVGSARGDLLTKYGLHGRTVITTMGRIDSTEKNKGFDEVIETLPILSSDVPDIAYLIVGDGNDRPRLEAKARELGVSDRVVFSGYIPEADKADHYRLAHVAAMPGSDRYYFDRYPYRFAFLEPLACGIPVVGSQFDCASERQDPVAQQLVIQVDPDDRADIKRGILQALAKGRNAIDPLLSQFDYRQFEEKTHAILAEELGRA